MKKFILIGIILVLSIGIGISFSLEKTSLESLPVDETVPLTDPPKSHKISLTESIDMSGP